MVTFCKLQKGMAIGRHYEIIKFLGQGSMGAVYQAKDQYFSDYNRTVACKILPRELRQTPGRDVYFKREFLAAQELVHQNICCTYEFGEDSELETYFLIMEFVQGETLRQLIAKNAYTLREALPIIEQIATGLDFAHHKGILHLDMKPDNIIVNQHGQVKIMDFGLARVVNQGMTHISLMEVEGTPLYMSPEQIDPQSARKRVDYAADRWAMGVIVYEMLAGYPPFDGRMGLTPLIYSILTAQPDRLDLPAGVWGVIQKMLSKNAKDRYPTCVEFYKALANPSIFSTAYIPLEKKDPFEDTRRKDKTSATSVFPLDSEENTATGTDLALGSAAPAQPTVPPLPAARPTVTPLPAAVSSSSVITIGEGPEEFALDPPPEPKKNEEEKPQRADPITQSRISIPGRKLDLPAFVWNEVKANYPHLPDVKKAQQARAFKFFTVNSCKYLIYRNIQTGIELVLIPSGEFWMGNQDREDERPFHKVYLDAYLMAIKPITQEAWHKVTRQNPSFFNKQGEYPVEQISWDELSDFCKRTSLEIPTEAQWERACRAGTVTTYYWGEEINGDYLWYSDNSGRTTHPAGAKKPNRFGIYDVCGNVWEWCRDDYREDAYQFHGKKNPIYLDATAVTRKVRRGGSWLNRAEGCRCAIRQCDEPSRRASGLGGRVSFSL